jgi:hypothetical protein
LGPVASLLYSFVLDRIENIASMVLLLLHVYLLPQKCAYLSIAYQKLPLFILLFQLPAAMPEHHT